MNQGFLAYAFTHFAYPIKAGDWCLIHAAAGGIGLLLCQMAKTPRRARDWRHLVRREGHVCPRGRRGCSHHLHAIRYRQRSAANHERPRSQRRLRRCRKRYIRCEPRQPGSRRISRDLRPVQWIRASVRPDDAAGKGILCFSPAPTDCPTSRSILATWNSSWRGSSRESSRSESIARIRLPRPRRRMRRSNSAESAGGYCFFHRVFVLRSHRCSPLLNTKQILPA